MEGSEINVVLKFDRDDLYQAVASALIDDVQGAVTRRVSELMVERIAEQLLSNVRDEQLSNAQQLVDDALRRFDIPMMVEREVERLVSADLKSYVRDRLTEYFTRDQPVPSP